MRLNGVFLHPAMGRFASPIPGRAIIKIVWFAHDSSLPEKFKSI
jgi:hypothetical protein